MAKERKNYWLILGLIIFVLYTFAAARPIPPETILVPRWLSSLESNYPMMVGPENSAETFDRSTDAQPFRLGNRFGYIDHQGRFIINRENKENLSLSENYWAEFGAIPESLDIRSPFDETILTVDKRRGYPFFRDGRVFLIGSEQNSVTALDREGDELWTYDFSSPLTTVAGAAGFLVAGSLDGRIEMLDEKGKLVFPPFEPGGSRLQAIYGCALSADASRIAIVSGIDDQRFLFLERSGESYRVVHHEFLGDGFRRPVHIAFIDNDNRVVFEKQNGLGIYDINSRTAISLPLNGEIRGFDGSGNDGFFFVVTAPSKNEKRLVAIRLPGTVIMEAPFKSSAAFLGRRGRQLYVGGGTTLASFELGKK
ncbi:hypothetical protein AGMMS49928_21240 [Spirochaetia bacterium]|nr:hypothetical protein AGMMS49928_21240 [Spirochaetia bacterium]